MWIPSAFQIVLFGLVFYYFRNLYRAIKFARANPDMTGYRSKTETDVIVSFLASAVSLVFYLLGAWLH